MSIDTRELVEELKELNPENEYDAERHAAITALFDELSNYGGNRPQAGIALIPDHEWEDYARELAEDVGMIDSSIHAYVDWKRFAEDLKMDYSSVEFEGTTYWYR